MKGIGQLCRDPTTTPNHETDEQIITTLLFGKVYLQSDFFEHLVEDVDFLFVRDHSYMLDYSYFAAHARN